MIELAAVTVEYNQARPLDGVSFGIPAGSTAVMGPSGSGKSSLLRVIAGLQAPTSGLVKIDSTPVAHATWRTASDSRVAVVHQDYRLVSFLTVEENLLLAAELRGRSLSGQEVSGAMARATLSHKLLHRHPASLSGGEQQRVAVARALVSGATVLLADEPTGALDATNTANVADLLAGLGSQVGLSVVVVTHDPDVAARMRRQVYIRAGKLSLSPA